MFVIEVLIVDGKPLYCLRNMQGSPVLNSFELSEVSDKISDAASKYLESIKPKEEK